VYVAPGISR